MEQFTFFDMVPEAPKPTPEPMPEIKTATAQERAAAVPAQVERAQNRVKRAANNLELYSERAQKTFYPTPDALLDKLLGGIDWNLVDSVLEPSAGKGNIARYCAEMLYRRRVGTRLKYEDTRRKAIEEADIDCIEIDADFRRELDNGGFRVVHDDFLTFQTHKRYSLIAMNPPFDEGAKHLLKALELCERGGTICCILNAETIRNPFSVERQELLNKLNGYGAEITCEAGAFADAERRTDVEVALIRVCIPQAQVDSTIMDDMRRAPTYKPQEVPESIGTLAQYDEIEQFVNRYNFEVACGIRLIEEYNAMAEYMIDDPGERYSKPMLSLRVCTKGREVIDSAKINDYVRETRGKYWRMIFCQPVIVKRMTSNLRQELYDSVQKLKDYEFSAYNILTLIIRMNGKTVKGIEETIIKLFDDWTRMYWSAESPNRHYYNGWKTNDCFRIGKKVIIPFYNAFEDWTGKKKISCWKVSDRFHDIEKVFDFLDSGRTDWIGSTEAALKAAEATGETRNIETKYFTVTFYKKGTAHLVFKDEKLLEKFNLFASTHKGWLPPSYGKKHYRDMDDQERAVIDAFQGAEKYEEVMREADYYLTDGKTLMLS